MLKKVLEYAWGSIWIILIFLVTAMPCRCERLMFDSFSRGTREIALVFGDLKSHAIPMRSSEKTELRLLELRIGHFVSSRVEYAVEISPAQEADCPDNDGVFITGCYRRFFYAKGPRAVAFDASFGAMLFEKRLISQSTRINFTEQLGISFHYAIGSNTAINLAFTFSHCSNAGIKPPNLGINASIITVGVSRYL
jgi:hypothetical protein